MIIIKYHLLFLFSSILLSRASCACIQTCGPLAVPFPFGFSSSCTIPLTCTSNTTVRIGEFAVHNFTSDNLLLSVPFSCTRPVNSTASLFAPNYALTRNNGFLLRNCTSSSSSLAQCSISGQILSQRLSCASGADSVRCFTDAANKSTAGSGEFLAEGELTATSCKFLLSSASIEAAPERYQSTVLVFQELEVGWWVTGTCGLCDQNAECTRVSGKGGVRCRCKEGFEGDGFRSGGGRGCRRG